MHAQVRETLLTRKKYMPWGFKKESAHIWRRGGENVKIFIEVCCIWDRPWGVGWVLMFICRRLYLLQLPSACLCISFTKVINSLDSYSNDLLAVPSLHFNWLTMNGGCYQHMLRYRTGSSWLEVFCWRKLSIQNIACIGGGDSASTSVTWDKIRPKHLWISWWLGIT